MIFFATPLAQAQSAQKIKKGEPAPFDGMIVNEDDARKIYALILRHNLDVDAYEAYILKDKQIDTLQQQAYKHALERNRALERELVVWKGVVAVETAFVIILSGTLVVKSW